MSICSEYRLIVFLKAPRPGFVKTRLAASVGPDKACEIYRELMGQVLSQIGEYRNVDLRISPDDAADAFRDWCRPGWRLLPQGNGGLGDRLSRAFEQAFQEGAQAVLAIGSDCPEVGPSAISKALDVLDRAPLTLGPAIDGGYWLIGMKAFFPSLFEGIDWSTDQVLEQTQVAAMELGLETVLLETLEDIDDLEGWKRFQARKIKKDENNY